MSDAEFEPIFKLKSQGSNATEIHLHRTLPNRVVHSIMAILAAHEASKQQSTPLPDAPWLQVVVDNKDETE